SGKRIIPPNKLIVTIILITVVNVNPEYLSTSILSIGTRIVISLTTKAMIKITPKSNEITTSGELQVLFPASLNPYNNEPKIIVLMIIPGTSAFVFVVTWYTLNHT